MRGARAKVLAAATLALAAALAGWAAAAAGMQDPQPGPVAATPATPGEDAPDAMTLSRRVVGALATGDALVEECRLVLASPSEVTGGAFDPARAEPPLDASELAAAEDAYARVGFGGLRQVGVLGDGTLVLEEPGDNRTRAFLVEPATLGEGWLVHERRAAGALDDGRLAVRTCALRVEAAP